jgi:uncharacterized protein YbaR (Trm112 family)
LIVAFNFDKLKNSLVCPKCHAELVQDSNALVCTNPNERLAFPILENIPRLLVVEAQELSADDWNAAMHRAGRS